MVTDKVVVQLPGVDVDMLVVRLVRLGERGADEHVVELLGVHVVDVRVALVDGDADDLVEVEQARLGGEGSQGLDEGELVEVTAGDDAGVGVLGEDLGDEGLVFCVSLCL